MSGYVSLAAARFGFARYKRGNANARFADAVLPHRWPLFRAAQGDHAIAAGSALAREGRLREALFQVGAGLRLSPANRDGRLLYAKLLEAANRHDVVRDTLLAGLEFHGADSDYLRPVFVSLLSRQEDDRVMEIARTALRHTDASDDVRRIAALAGATASFNRGNYDEAEEFLEAGGRVEASVDALVLASRIEWERGFRDLALLQLRTLADSRPEDAAFHHELCVRLSQRGLKEEARRRALAFQMAHPASLEARLALAQAYHATGDSAASARETDALLRECSGEPSALLALGEFAAGSGNPALAAAVLAHAERGGVQTDAHACFHIEALLAARDFEGALAAIRSRQRAHAGVPQQAALLDSLQAVAYWGAGETENSRLSLRNFLERPALRSENLLALANRFADLGAADESCRILERAVALDPLNQAALSRLIELELNLDRLDALPEHLLRLVAMRKPSTDLLRVAQYKLSSATLPFSEKRATALTAISAALEKTTVAGTRPR